MPEPPAQTHAMEFAFHALPSLFHLSPASFMQFLSRDGNQFLAFYWMQAAKAYTGFERASYYGLDHEFRIPSTDTTIALVTLPKPQRPGEAYFMALAHRPYRRILFVADTTKVLLLESETGKEEGDTTRLVEINKHFKAEDLGAGPAPNREAFYLAVLEQLQG